MLIHSVFFWLRKDLTSAERTLFDSEVRRLAQISYLERGYVASQRIGAEGLTGQLYAVVPERLATRPYVTDFVQVMRETSLLTLPGITLL